MSNIAVHRTCETLRNQLCDEGLPPLVARILSARNINTAADAAPPLATLPPPQFLPDIEKICDILADTIKNQCKICVIGDYDADGICATALATQCLEAMGATVIWKIPGRVRHGYGLHPEIVDQAAAADAAVLLTVDNGISANIAVQHAKSCNMTVCVTDHHLPPKTLPPADCIVNPQLANNNIGVNLAGVGVAFYVLAALRRRFSIPFRMSQFLDLVAVGTVADCVPMDVINRTLVGAGIEQLNTGARLGLSALTIAAGRRVNCRTISHFIAPRINAAGRFDRADLAVECMLAVNRKIANKKSAALFQLNEKRKTLVDKIMTEIDSLPPQPAAIVLADKSWLPGVAGIIAGKLAEKYHCPTIIFTHCNNVWRGSGRTPPEYNLHELVAIAARDITTVLGFGGHRRAIGITVQEVAPFKNAFYAVCEQTDIEDLPLWQVDKIPPMSEITPQAVTYLENMVWGESFVRPLFVGDFNISDIRPMGQTHLRMRINGDGLDLPAIAFNRQSLGNRAEAVFSLTTDYYTHQITAVIESVISSV